MPVAFEGLVVGPLATNCYVLWDRSTRAAAIIDPGGDAARIREVVSSNDLNPVGILLTHGHLDHCYAAGSVAREYEVEIYIHEADVGLVEQIPPMLELIYDLSAFVSPSPLKFVEDGDVIHLGDCSIHVIHTPGHSPGGVCFVTDAGVFCGDTIFAGSIGRTDLPGSDYNRLIDSVKTRLLTLPDPTPLYPGHGPSTTVAHEKTTNPFLD